MASRDARFNLNISDLPQVKEMVEQLAAQVDSLTTERDEALWKAQTYLELAAARGTERDRLAREHVRATTERDHAQALLVEEQRARVANDEYLGAEVDRLEKLLGEEQRDHAATRTELAAVRGALEMHGDEREAMRLRLMQAFGVEGRSLASLLSIAEMAWEHGQQHKAELERQRPVIEAARAWKAACADEPGTDIFDATEGLLAAVDALGSAAPTEEG